MVDWWTAICTATYNSLLGPDPEITQQTVQKAVSPSLSTRLQLNIPATLTSLRDYFYGACNVSPPQKNGTRKNGASHNGVADDTSIVGSAAVSLGEKFPAFKKIGMHSKQNVDCFSLKMKALGPIKISETTFPTTQRHTPEDL